ncbi:MAG: SURF1 family protein [Alphaproteobacteria bacterium]|nr:SURF1 family protein [Alphaproteobacteria bacterium]
MKSSDMLAGRQFHFYPALTIFAIISLGILVFLGVWQLQRLEWKQGLIEKVEARIHQPPIPLDDAVWRWRGGEDMEYMPVRVSGVYLQVGEAKIFGLLEGRAGAYIFTPLLRHESAKAESKIIYVNRGFALQSVSDSVLWSNELEMSYKSVEGLFRTAEQRPGIAGAFRPTDSPDENQWYLRDPRLFASNAGLDAPPYYIDSFAIEGAQWPKGGTTRLDFSNRHLEYALTWFGLALTLIGVWLAFSLQKTK